MKMMRFLKFSGVLKLIFQLTILIIIGSSCKKDKEIDLDYVGKWVTVKSVPSSSGLVSVNYSLELTDQTFIETFLTDIYQYSYNSPGKLATIEGSISISKNIMSFIPHKISFSYYNLATSIASEPYETFTDKDQFFDGIFHGLVMPTSNYQIEYSIVVGQLILRVDYNADGIYSENEKLVYTQQ